MAARFLLVALVAGMGLQPPSREEVSSFVARGRTWVAARLDDWSVTNARRASEAHDRAFRTIVEEMSRNFSVDLARMDAKKSEPARLVAFEPILVPDSEELEPISVPDEYEKDVVSALIAEGVSRDDRTVVADVFEPDFVARLIRETEAVEPAPAPAVEAEVLTQTEPASAPAVAPVLGSSPSPARSERLTSAVNLTRQAFVAWASLLSGPGAIVAR